MPPSAIPPPSTAAGTSKKRKLGEGETKQVKYYAVRTGKTPGVYTSWDDCKNNTYGFKGAIFKSFLTHSDAAAFVAGKNPPNPTAPAKFYGLAVGDKPGVYTDWAECQRNMIDTKGPKYRKFSTKKEAEEFVRDWKAWGKKAKEKGVGGVEGDGEGEDGEGERLVVEEEEGPSAKKAKAAGGGHDVGGPKKKKGQKAVEKIYTDGSSLGNGKAGSSAGVGVYFGANDPRNISESLPGTLQTNQRAELTAIIRALETVPSSTPVEIITDSKYSINCVTDWYKNWMKKDWVTSTGGKVLNRDLVERARELIDERKDSGAETAFTWVKGHSGGEGNEAADRLAVAGARRK